jgi:hypothetical protein
MCDQTQKAGVVREFAQGLDLFPNLHRRRVIGGNPERALFLHTIEPGAARVLEIVLGRRKKRADGRAGPPDLSHPIEPAIGAATLPQLPGKALPGPSASAGPFRAGGVPSQKNRKS